MNNSFLQFFRKRRKPPLAPMDAQGVESAADALEYSGQVSHGNGRTISAGSGGVFGHVRGWPHKVEFGPTSCAKTRERAARWLYGYNVKP